MNRLVSVNMDQVTAAGLPPERREGRARILFVTNDMLGWRTFASTIEQFAAKRDDVDAVHIRLESRRAVRILSARVPGVGRWLPPHVRLVLLWQRMLRRWLTGPLPLSRFDVVHVAPQLPALAVAELKSGWGGGFSVSVDATVLEAKAQRHGTSLDELGRVFGPILRAERRVLEQADLVAPMSRWSSDALQREYLVPSERIFLLPPVVDVSVYATPTDRDGLGTDPVKMAFVGNDWERKGGRRLVAWHQEHWADRAELHVFSSAAPVTGLRNVVWHGCVPHQDLMERWLPAMDFFVLPTRSDMSPWAAVEAASVGLPIVSTDMAGLPDIVVHGETGYLLAVDDDRGYLGAVQRLIDQPELRGRLGRAARRHAGAHLSSHAATGAFFDRLVRLAR